MLRKEARCCLRSHNEMKAREAKLFDLNEFLQRSNTLIFKDSNILNISFAILNLLCTFITNRKRIFKVLTKILKSL